MRTLLDTHVALWSIGQPSRLSSEVRRQIESGDGTMVSVVSIWEIAIKFARPKGRPDDITISGREAHAMFEAAGFTLLPVTPVHSAAVDDLPTLHGDPFDRLLVAQALTEPLNLLTHDRRLADYGAIVKLV